MTTLAARRYLPLDLHGAFLRRTNLADATLVGANLAGADLSNADLRGADLRDANLRGTILHGADLTGVRNLTARQLREAIVDERTKLPEDVAP
jgi:uncharacterized protein YjbI with pentapeptide repeats